VTLVEASPNLCRVQHEALAGTLPPQAPNVLAGNAYLTSQTRAALPISVCGCANPSEPFCGRRITNPVERPFILLENKNKALHSVTAVVPTA
jgi:hypothetical protein